MAEPSAVAADLAPLALVVVEPRHRGLHIAAVDRAVADRRGWTSLLATGPVFVRITNRRTGDHAFARLDISDGIGDAVGVQGYISDNCAARPGTEVTVELWDPDQQAEPATEIHLVPVGTATHGLARDVRQRLADARQTLLTGHRFSLPIGHGEPMFQVVTAVPPGIPIRCTHDTQVTIQPPAEGADPADSTARPAPRPGVFDEIGGLEGPIQKITELVIWPSRHPMLFRRLGIRAAKGVILHGPPGNGKTLLARAVAHRLGAHFFAINGPEILSKFYGETEERLRRVFTDAARQQPSVVFLDELDSIAPSREHVSGDLEVRLVSQLLTLMDGLDDRGQVVVIAATNRLSAVDPALRRPGRFDHEVEIAPPGPTERRAILGIHTRPMPLAADADLDEIAARTVGFVGADLANLCQEAALVAARRVLSAPPASQDGDEPPHSTVRVEQADLMAGLRGIQPSAFRQLQQPRSPRAWEEIVGLGRAKQTLIELLEWPTSRREQLAALGIGASGGILLTGPAMSGKTTLVTALARRLNMSLVYVPSIDLLSARLGDSERAIRDAFAKARQTSPSIVMIDNFEQLAMLQATGAELPQRVLAQVQRELAQVSYAATVSVVVAARGEGGHLTAVAQDPLFSYVIELDVPAAPDVRRVIEERVGRYTEAPGSPDHSDATGSLDAVADRLVGHPIGRVLQVCDEAIKCALWEHPEAPVVAGRHFDTAITRIAAKPYEPRGA